MKSKRITAAIAGMLLAWGTAYGEEPQGATLGDVPDAIGATGPGILILELQGTQPGAELSAEELSMLQALLLQLLMMQSQPGSGEIQIIAPTTAPGVGI